MSPPLIGITTFGRDDKNQFILPAEYVDAVRRAGGLYALLAPMEARFEELVELLDGLVLSGGGDLDPELYGGVPSDTVYMVDPERDASELELSRRAVAAGLPTLAICRGTQVLNVALGGTLIEHLPETGEASINHRLPPREPTEHKVTLQRGSRVAEILCRLEFTSASWHHQAIRDVAAGLEAVAHAPDGTIEAVEMPDHPWLIGVQWHPELTAARDPPQQRLFTALVRAAGKRRGGRK